VDANEDYVCFIASAFWKTVLIFCNRDIHITLKLPN
jgi:hypothetical protein